MPDPATLKLIALWLVAAALMLVGLGGLILPAIPGAPVLFAGLLMAAWIEDFEYVGWGTITVLAALAILTYVADFVAGACGAQRFGASPRAVTGAVLGALLGVFLGLPGVLLGPFVGAAIGEFTARRNLQAAGRAGIGATIGLALGVAAKLALAFSMLGVFALARFL
jgi:uncharacterized protein YqgC (DUF456 family)